MKKFIYVFIIMAIFLSSSCKTVKADYELQGEFTGIVMVPDVVGNVFTTTDNIGVYVKGMGENPAPIVNYLNVDGDTVTLVVDVDYSTSSSKTSVPWQIYQDIGFMDEGNYTLDLFVNNHVFDNQNMALSAHESYDFSVVPEPTTLMLLGTGFLFLKRRKIS